MATAVAVGGAPQLMADAMPMPAVASADPRSAAPVERDSADAVPSGDLRAEIIWGGNRQFHAIPLTGATIGSTGEADITVSAGFLAPVHASLGQVDGVWTLSALAPGAAVLRRGGTSRSVAVESGDVLRIADGIGNFVTMKVTVSSRPRRHDSGLRATLPEPGNSYLIGSDPSCAVRLEHPLVQRRHAALRRDDAGGLWLEDRGTAAGTYVNGHRLRGRQRLAPGDVLQIGPFSAAIGSTSMEPLEQLAGVDIDVRNVSIAVAPRKAPSRVLLHNVSMHLEPATLTAVVGPSGAGKTTLMRMLSGQVSPSEGAVFYNGRDLSGCREGYSELMGFVPQDDVVHVDLTVREALDYQARLRLGSSMTDTERGNRIDQLLTMLGLASQHEQLVRTLSGGQRKRVSIACELLKEPQLLFLDEPTSGLDPGLDKRMMLLLRLLADQGRTVLLTTHAIAHVDVCDTLILVGPGGHVMYVGAPEDAVAWFGVASLADVFSLTETPVAAALAAAKRSLPGAAVPAAAGSGLADPGPIGGAASAQEERPQVGTPAWRKALVRHSRIFAGRQLRLIRRDRQALAFTLLQGVVVALLTVVVAPRPFTWSVDGNSVGFVFGCASVWFGMISAIRELVKERAIWRREFMAGGSLPAYLCAKATVLAGLGFVQALTLTIALSLTLGLPAANSVGGPLVSVLLTLWLGYVAGMAIGLFVSATSSSADRALSLVPYLLVAQLVLCGVLFRLGAGTVISWIMPARWAVSGIGGIAGLSAARLNQSSGLYPHGAAGLLLCWVMLMLIAAAGLAATAASLRRQGRSWSTGAESAPPLVKSAMSWLRRQLAATPDEGSGRA